MDKEMKRLFRNNVIKFVIGIVLLSFSFMYLNNHPAERSAIFSGFEVMFQRIQIYVLKVVKQDPELLKSKFDYQKTYEELVHMAESNACLDQTVVAEINDLLHTLKRETTKNLAENLPTYIRKASEYKNKISQSCNK